MIPTALLWFACLTPKALKLARLEIALIEPSFKNPFHRILSRTLKAFPKGNPYRTLNPKP